MKTPPLGMTEANFCAIVDPLSPNPKDAAWQGDRTVKPLAMGI
jgi:hypothetical protein